MCGLTGIIMKQKTRDAKSLVEIKNAMKRQLVSADTRGGHATGFAQIDSLGDYAITKLPLNAYKFIETNVSKQAFQLVDSDVTVLMGHTRFATQGDKSNSANNHPIRAGKTIGTHNGSISNDDELFDKYEMERFAEVDSEVIFRLHDTATDVDDFVKNRVPKIRGAMSIVWCDVEFPDYVYLIKGNNPLSMYWNKKHDVICYGSTDTIATSGFENVNMERIEIPANTMVRVDTRTMERRTITVDFRGRLGFEGWDYDSEIGAFKQKKKKPKKQKHANGFVPRFTFREQLDQLELK